MPGQSAFNPLESSKLEGGGDASPPTMFRISDFRGNDNVPADEKEVLALELSTGGPKEPSSPSCKNPELRRRIGSDPPFQDSETPDELGTFRARSRSAPPILWAAQRYGRELRRMSDEFHGALQKLPRPKSAGTCSQMHPMPGWKEALRAWWRRSDRPTSPS